MKALILAAGAGTRLANDGETLPKPLARLGGLPLLERGIRTALKAGATEVLVTLGHRKDEIRDALTPRIKGLPVRWIESAEWERGNGASALAAREAVGDEPCLVLMADHVYEARMLRELLEATRADTQALMAVDRKWRRLADLDDAMKVRIESGRVTAVAKDLEPFDAVDVGATICPPRFFAALADVARDPDAPVAHSEGMRRLAKAGLLVPHDVRDARWEDVDTAPAREAAERFLYDSLRKESDGLLSRLVERRLSLAVTRLLVDTPVRPNHVTVALVGLGAIAAFFFAQGGTAPKVLGAVLFWCASFLDGCDGELARLRFEESRLGGWLDLWSDNVVHMMVFYAMGVGVARDTGDPFWRILGLVAAVGVLLAVSWVSMRVVRSGRRSGPVYVSTTGADRSARGGLSRVADALSRRDFIPFTIVLAALGWIPWFLWAAAIGVNLYVVLLVASTIAERDGSTQNG